MAQNTIQDKNDLYLEDVIIYIADFSTSLTNDSLTDVTGASWTNLGAVMEFSREAAVESVEPESFNVEHDQFITKEAENINITLQEINLTVINQLKGGISQAQSVSGTTNSTNFVIAAAAVTLGEPTKLPQQDFTGNVSVPQSIDESLFSIFLDGSTGAALSTAAYRVVALNDGQGNYGVIPFTTAWDVAIASSVNYDFVPLASSLLWSGDAETTTPFMLWVYAQMSDGRVIETFYPEVHYVSGGQVSDKQRNSGSFKDVPFGLQAREHDSFLYNSRKQYKIDRISS
jgi:hypothetical protein